MAAASATGRLQIQHWTLCRGGPHRGRLGDVFYDGVAARADPLIDQWKRETAYEEKPHE